LPLCTVRSFGLVLAVLGETALAQGAAIEPPGPSTAAILQMLLGLTLIIAILFAGAYLLRKLNGGRSFGSSGPLRIVGGLMLSARERIVLVEVGDSWIVVGIVPGQIKTLHTLPKGDLPAASGGEKPFALWLKQISERKK
jgi:flagellar protein FliO/FliZ